MSKLSHLKSTHALACRYHGFNSAEARAIRAELRAEKTTVYIQRLLNEAPPLSPEQRSKLAGLLRPAREAIVAARLAELDTRGAGDGL